MYLEYFGFECEPFNITPNSRFLFLSERHREALGSLLYGIEQRKGFIALTGEIGCGKTTICRALLGKLDRERVHLALVLNPQLNDLDLLQTINEEFGVDADSDSKRVLLGNLNQFLLEKYRDDHIVVLVIDEAQRLSPDALEQVRLLSNLETESAKLIQIALVGQPELADLLDLPELEQLNQRITVRSHIYPLSLEEISEYIAHRIKIAKPKAEISFTKKALRKIYEFSGGVPRRVNVVCDRSLLVTYVREQKEVSEENVIQAIGDLGGMPKRHKKRGAEKSGKNEEPEEPREQQQWGTKTNPWPIGIAVLFGLVAIAYAITTLSGGGDSSGPVTTNPGNGNEVSINIDNDPPPVAPNPTLSPTPTETVAPAKTEMVVAAATTKAPATATPALTKTLAPSPTERAVPTAVERFFPTPTEPKASATPQPSASAVVKSPEPTPSVVEETKAVAAVQATETLPLEKTAPPPTPTVEPTELVLVETMVATPTPEPTPIEPWSYDEDKVLRVSDAAYSYPAAVLTWLSMMKKVELPESQLALLRGWSKEQITALELTDGVHPHYVREARLPANLDDVSSVQLPLLVQVDNDAPDFGPGAVLVSIDQEWSTLYDPRGGKLQAPTETLDDHLTSLIMLFFDPDQLVGLRPLDRNDRVRSLQLRLQDLGLYKVEPTGVFDPFTKSVVDRFREVQLLPASDAIDPLFAVRLYAELENKQ